MTKEDFDMLWKNEGFRQTVQNLFPIKITVQCDHCHEFSVPLACLEGLCCAVCQHIITWSRKGKP